MRPKAESCPARTPNPTSTAMKKWVPNANAYAERFVRSTKEECLDRLILIGERHFRRALTEHTYSAVHLKFSWIPIAPMVDTTPVNAASRSCSRYRGAWSSEKALPSCWAVHPAVGWSVTAT